MSFGGLGVGNILGGIVGPQGVGGILGGLFGSRQSPNTRFQQFRGGVAPGPSSQPRLGNMLDPVSNQNVRPQAERVQGFLQKNNGQANTTPPPRQKGITGMSPQLGHISAKFESSGRGPSMISHGRGDPGGVSYGVHQLSSKAGSLQGFLKSSGFSKDFSGLRPATPAFNRKWREMSKNPKFVQGQKDYLTRTHFNPVREHASKLGIPETRADQRGLIFHGSAARRC